MDTTEIKPEVDSTATLKVLSPKDAELKFKVQLFDGNVYIIKCNFITFLPEDEALFMAFMKIIKRDDTDPVAIFSIDEVKSVINIHPYESNVELS